MKKRKPVVVEKPPAEVIASDVVYWGLVDGHSGLPEILMLDRNRLKALAAMVPNSDIVRTYITVQAVQARRRSRRAS